MGGGGSQQEKVSTTGSAGAPQLVPEFQPFGAAVGQKALAATNFPELDLQRFANDQQLQIPGLSPLQLGVRDQVANRLQNGIPVPEAQQQAFGMYSSLPQVVGQTVGMSPFSTAGVNTAAGLANNSGISHPNEDLGANTMFNYSSGDVGNSPAIQQALAGLESQITPQVQNQAAKIGLGQSGFLPMEIGRQYARELVPLYLQGQQMQLTAGNQLANLGSTQAARALGGQQFLSQAQTGFGTQEQQMQTDALSRYLQGTTQAAQGLESIGKTEDARAIEGMKEALAMGELERSVQQDTSQADLDSFLRAREMALGLVNPFGSFTAFSGVPSTTQTRDLSGGGGLGFGK